MLLSQRTLTYIWQTLKNCTTWLDPNQFRQTCFIQLDYWKSYIKIKPHTVIKVSTDINTADYIWHQKESPHISHKAQLLYPRSFSPSIWSPSLAPRQLPPKERGHGVQSKRLSATVSWTELTGDVAPWAECISKLLSDLWLHSQSWKWQTSKIISHNLGGR